MAEINDVAAQETAPKEKYKGTGRSTAAIGASTVGLGIGVGLTAAATGAENLIKNQKFSNFLHSTSGLVTASVTTGLLAIIGLVKGWRSASKGKKQFEAQQAELATIHATIGELNAVGVEQNRKFTDIINAKQQQFDSFAAKVEADKANASVQHSSHHAEELADTAHHGSHADHHAQHESHTAGVEASKAAEAEHAL